MASRVTPKESCVNDIGEDQAQISTQPVANDDSMVESRINYQIVNEELLKVIEGAYRPILRLLKLFGVFHGDTSFKCLLQTCSLRQKDSYVGRLYCVIVIFCLWFNFIMPLVSIFYGGNIYLHFMFLGWFLLPALLGTTCLIVLPLSTTRKSRFENFLRKLITIRIQSANLEKVQKQARVFLVVFSVLCITAVVGAILTDKILSVSLGNIPPWNEWFVFSVTSLIFLTYDCCIWAFTLPIFGVTCSILGALFDDFLRKISSLHPVQIGVAFLRKEHQNLVEVVDIADKMISPFLLVIVSVLIPVTCFNFYQIINPGHLPKDERLLFIIINVYFLLNSVFAMAFITVAGSGVHEKVRKAIREAYCNFLLMRFMMLDYQNKLVDEVILTLKAFCSPVFTCFLFSNFCMYE